MTKDELLLENERLKRVNAILAEALKNNAPKAAIALGFDIQESKIKTPLKQRNEKRDFEICFDCNEANANGAGWHLEEGGVYSIAGKLHDLSSSTVQGIYNSPENKQHWKQTK